MTVARVDAFRHFRISYQHNNLNVLSAASKCRSQCGAEGPPTCDYYRLGVIHQLKLFALKLLEKRRPPLQVLPLFLYQILLLLVVELFIIYLFAMFGGALGFTVNILHRCMGLGILGRCLRALRLRLL